MDSDGGKVMPGPEAATMSSGFGGLGLEGMMGSEDSVGASPSPAGEGNRGLISGERVGEEGEERGGFGSNAGAAEMVEVGKADSEDKVEIKTKTKRMSVDAIK